ncbi:Gfo/Idh/MocA family protein [Pantoea cypripedii]|uniref:Oxidoreductase n=1 Tax=Pantoea cypripedii TaxID=55209 RepID=A0A6B9G8V8_PANCY|nr:Gfo/Idh/MocA family oxidoreductase [Pantoea cypripedii]QGY32952.1 oxidoreductase [Pantoea cypripedii]
MFRWGVLSTAKIGHERLYPAIQDSHYGVLTAVASRDFNKARAMADRFGAPLAFGSYEELLASDEIDGVYIPLPSSQHIEWALKAAEAGKHVLVEKPVALHAGEIDQLVEAAERHKVVISEAYMVTYHPQWAKVRELIAEGAIGNLRQVQGSFCFYTDDATDMRNQLALGGGALPDIGVYPVVTTRFATGKEPLRTQAIVKCDPASGVDTYSSVRMDFGDFELSFYVSFQLAVKQSMVFHGDKGYIELSAPFNAGLYDHERVELHNLSHTGTQVWRYPDTRQYRLQLDAFAQAAQGNDVNVFSLKNSYLNQKAIDAIYRAGEHDGWETV